MADKAITDLNTAPSTVDDSNTYFVVQQSGAAYKLTGHEFILALTTILDGHGGINTITGPSTSGLEDTYTITYADQTTTTFTVTNGNGVSAIQQYWAVSASNTTAPSTWYTAVQTMTSTYKYLWSYITFTLDDGTLSTTPSVIGVYGDTGDSWYVWIRYAGAQPTSDADIGTTPDDWIGIYSGTSSTAPTTYTSYSWYEYKGEKGDTGDAAEIDSQSVMYCEGSSGTVVPSGTWTSSVPSVTSGNYLWTRTILEFSEGTTVTFYGVSRFGLDGTGSVTTVNGLSPDANGNVAIDADDIPTDDNTSVQSHLDDLEDIVGSTTLTTTAQTVTAAVNELDAEIAALGSDDIANDSSNVSGSTVTDAIDALKTDLTSAESDISDLEDAKIPSGGAAGKALIKASATDYDCTWGDAGGALWFTSVSVSATTGDIATVSDSAITADHVLGRIEWADPSYITTDVTWTTSSGSLVLNGTCSTATTASVLLVLKNN